MDRSVLNRHQSDLAGSAVPIARAVCRRRCCGSAIAIWTADKPVPDSSRVEEEPAAGTVLLDDDARGVPRRHDAALLDCGIVCRGDVDHLGDDASPELFRNFGANFRNTRASWRCKCKLPERRSERTSSMEKTYLRYRSSWSVGVITSPRPWTLATDDGCVVVGSTRDVVTWDLSVDQPGQRYRGDVEGGFATSPNEGARGEVIAVATPKKKDTAVAVAAAYASGVVRVWRGRDDEDRCDYDGQAVVLRWSESGGLLAAGGANGDVLIWDVVAMKLQKKLSSNLNNDRCKDVCFLREDAFLVAVQENSLKLWDLETRFCVATVDLALLTLDVFQGRIVAAGSDPEIRCFDDSLQSQGVLRRKRTSEACVALRFSKTGRYLGALSSRAIEIYGWAQKKKKRRRKEEEFRDEMELIATVLPNHPRSFVFPTENTIAVTTRHNTIETHRVGEETMVRSLTTVGHRGPVRGVDLSRDGLAVAAAAGTGVKIWSTDGTTLHRDISLPRKKVFAVKFLGNAGVVVGTDDGTVSVIDVAKGTTIVDLFTPEESKSAVWALDVREDESHVDVVAGGADHRVRLYRRRKEWKKGKVLDAGDEVLAVKFTQKMVAVSTMDATIRLFQTPSLKFKIALYGHAMPALCVDAADDFNLLASAGADKTLKFWGPDFGDLRRSTLAHSDAVTSLLFLPATHYVITASKDGDIKMWDADRQEPFVQIFKRGHVSEVWCLCCSKGDVIISGGADRSIRCWQRTDEPLIASEEADQLLENTLDIDDQQRSSQRRGAVVSPPDIVDDTARPATSRAADRLSEALDLAAAEEDSGARPNPLLLNLSPEKFVVNRLKTVPFADLERAVLLLSIGNVARLFHFLHRHLETDSSDVEICARAVNFAVTVHRSAVIAHAPLRGTLAGLRDLLRSHLEKHRQLFGANLAALRFASLLPTSSED